MGHGGGMADQAFNATKALSHREPPEPFAQGIGLLLCGVEADGDDGAATRHLLFGHRVLRVVMTMGVAHPVDAGMQCQQIGEGGGVGHLLFQSQRQRFDATGDQPAVEGGRLETQCFLGEHHLLVPFRVVGADHTAEGI